MLTKGTRPFELATPVNESDHLIGPEQAPVVVVEYGDFECPNCKQAAPAVKQLLAHFPDQVRFVYRHFPLEAVHPRALLAAEAAEYAGEQGRFWEMHDLLFARQPQLDLDHLRQYAASLALDTRNFDTAMQQHLFVPKVRQHIVSGEQSGVRSTPGFFVNGRILDVSFGIRSLFEATEAALSNR